MNKLQSVLRVSQRLAQRLDAVQTRLAGKSAERVYVFDCRFRIFGIHNSFFPCIIMIHLIITQFHQIENGEWKMENYLSAKGAALTSSEHSFSIFNSPLET